MDMFKAGPSSSEPDAEQAYFRPMGPSLYEYKNRPRRDIWATILFLAVTGVAIIGSIAAFSLTDQDAFNGSYSSEFYANSTSCSLSDFTASQPANTTGTNTFGSSFAISVGIWLPISVIAAITFSIGYLYLFRRHAVKMVYISVIASVAFSIAIAIASFIAGGVAGGIILLVVALISAGIYWWIRDQLKLCGQLLAISGRGLQECPGIIPSAVLIKFAGVGIMVFLFAGLICGVFVGKVVTNPQRLMAVPTGPSTGTCYDKYGYVVDCCTYSTQSWAFAHCILAAISLSWTAQVLLQLKLYIVADTMAQWYFQAPGNPDPSTQPSARRALRNGLTSSFGSLCFAGLILAIISALRNAMNRAQHNSQGIMRIICCILNCIAQCFLELLEQFTRFATIATAITGKGFVPAAKDMFDLLKRNFLATYTLWWIPDMVLGMTVFLITLAWSCIVFFATYLQWKDDFSSGDAVGISFAVASVALATMGFILHFVASIMLDGVNSIYICFALDRDHKVVSHPEIHQIYEALPTLQGAVIEQPDGGVAYGAPTQAPPQQPAFGTAQQQQQHYAAAGPAAGGYAQPGTQYGGGFPPEGYGQPGPSGYGQPAYGGYPQQAPPPYGSK